MTISEANSSSPTKQGDVFILFSAEPKTRLTC
jgi:hypothetical protein